jgi:hypothetical protein
LLLVLVVIAPAIGAGAQQGSPPARLVDEAQRLFYNARFEEAAALTAQSCSGGLDALAACEVRTSAVLFRMKRAFGDPEDRDRAWKACALCQELAPVFLADVRRGQSTARAHLQSQPDDEEVLFLLGKIDLNYVWFQLGTAGKKTGWSEYWEARKSLDKVLKRSPTHVRARVARAWIDYIVDTRMPRGTRWILGGGNKKRGLATVREAANDDTDFFARTEALFGLWEMLMRERSVAEAVLSARELLQDFPENADLRRFLDTHDRPTQRQ